MIDLSKKFVCLVIFSNISSNNKKILVEVLEERPYCNTMIRFLDSKTMKDIIEKRDDIYGPNQLIQRMEDVLIERFVARTSVALEGKKNMGSI